MKLGLIVGIFLLNIYSGKSQNSREIFSTNLHHVDSLFEKKVLVDTLSWKRNLNDSLSLSFDHVNYDLKLNFFVSKAEKSNSKSRRIKEENIINKAIELDKEEIMNEITCSDSLYFKIAQFPLLNSYSLSLIEGPSQENKEFYVFYKFLTYNTNLDSFMVLLVGNLDSIDNANSLLATVELDLSRSFVFNDQFGSSGSKGR